MRVGIVGSGSIVSGFLWAASQAGGYECVAICARPASHGRIEAHAHEWGVPRTRTDYDQMLASPDIDVVYVAVANDVHHDYARRALLAGKHVIVEKPFTLTVAQAQDLTDVAHDCGRLLFEAAPVRDLPNVARIRELLPSIGPVRMALLNYSQRSACYDEFLAGGLPSQFDAARGGGALMDLGVYNVHLAVWLFGEPREVSYHATWARGVDTSGTLVMDYDGFTCACTAAKDSDAPNRGSEAPGWVVIQGERGRIYSDTSANDLTEVHLELADGTTQTFRQADRGQRMTHQLVAFRQMLEAWDLDDCQCYLDESLLVMGILEHALCGDGAIG